MSRGVDDVDFHAVVMDCGIFRKDGDAAFAFKGVAVHNAIFNLLILAEGATLFKHFVNQRGFAVVDVGDNCNVS